MLTASSAIPLLVEAFDDGHSPGGTIVPTKLVHYTKKNSTNFLSVFDNLLPDEWRERAYEYAFSRQLPWGVYVTMSDALDEGKSADQLWADEKYQEAIALRAVRSLLLERGNSLIGSDIDKLHGTAVWCLTSAETDEVRYHIDYAELHRYETNTIFPPVYAGTCHLSPVRGPTDMIGGDFQANVDGLEHYKRFGYKTKLQPPEEFSADLDNPQWFRVPYLCNRGILHDGDFPHLSTEIKFIRPGLRRVILGFNVFTDHVSECNLRAPEHSDAFNRTIKLYQRMASAGVPMTIASAVDQGPGDTNETAASSATPAKKAGGISAKDIMKNPALARLLVQAARKAKGLS